MRNNFRIIRKRLGLTQEAMGKGVGCTQANVGHVESGRQALTPDLAHRTIEFAAQMGVKVTFDDLYEEGRFSEENAGPQSTFPEGVTHG